MPGQTVGIIGLGIMGSAVSGNLLEGGFEVVGFDVRREQVRALEARGGRGLASACAVAEAAALVITLLPDERALDEVVAGEQGLVAAAREGLVLLECSTLPIDCKETARRALEQRSGS